MHKRTVSTALAKYAANSIVSRVAGSIPWYALLETRGRTTGRPRRTPVGDGFRGDVFWIVAEHGLSSSFAKNIRHDPRVRVRTHGRWRAGPRRTGCSCGWRARRSSPCGSRSSRLARRAVLGSASGIALTPQRDPVRPQLEP